MLLQLGTWTIAVANILFMLAMLVFLCLGHCQRLTTECPIQHIKRPTARRTLRQHRTRPTVHRQSPCGATNPSELRSLTLNNVDAAMPPAHGKNAECTYTSNSLVPPNHPYPPSQGLKTRTMFVCMLCKQHVDCAADGSLMVLAPHTRIKPHKLRLM